MTAKPWDYLKPGETWRGFWDGVPLGLPVLAARGANDGPTFVITGGIHGDEYEGPAAIHALFQTLDPTMLAGRVLGLPVVNVAAWNARARCAPGDGVDLNRIFPSSLFDAESIQLAETVFTHFVSPCDVLFDLHSGGAALVHLPMMGWYVGKTASNVSDAEQLARNLGGNFWPWQIPDVSGVLSYEAHRTGKLAIGAEWGGGGSIDLAGVDAYAHALRAALCRLGMLPGTSADAPDPRAALAGDYQSAPVDGLLLPCVALGDRVTAGQPLGAMDDALGLPVDSIPAARTGMVAGLAHRGLLRAGERVAYIG